MEEWISKKDLLAEMEISYGQLYRWKREKLIPDSWFVKRSSFTGQETFLPRERTLERIRFILENKDAYTLQELQHRLSPESGSRSYSAEVIASLPGTMRPAMILSELAGTDIFNHGQALCILIGAQIASACGLSDELLASTLRALYAWQEKLNLMQSEDGRFVLVKSAEAYLPLYLHPDSEIELPQDAELLYDLSLSDIPEKFNKQLYGLLEEE